MSYEALTVTRPTQDATSTPLRNSSGKSSLLRMRMHSGFPSTNYMTLSEGLDLSAPLFPELERVAAFSINTQHCCEQKRR